jgi:hypothetical protein
VARHGIPTEAPTMASPMATRDATPQEDRCTPPAFAVAIGHVEKWKQHNNCQ